VLSIAIALDPATADRRQRAFTVRYTGDGVVYDTRAGGHVPVRHPALVNGQALDSTQYPMLPVD
jgi:hypothetical protein